MQMASALIYFSKHGSWMMGVLAGKKASVLRAVSILEEFGTSLGIFINLSKCEVFSRNDLHSFPAAMKTSHLPHMVILGAPISDYLFSANFISSKRLDAVKLLSKLVEVATIDPLGGANSVACMWEFL